VLEPRGQGHSDARDGFINAVIRQRARLRIASSWCSGSGALPSPPRFRNAWRPRFCPVRLMPQG